MNTPSASRVASSFLKTAGMPDGNWADYDRSAPTTYWGPAQTMYEIMRGVRWFHTAGHGGLAVADGVARKLLSPAAYRLGARQGGYMWYEEDAAYAIPFYEHPEWSVALSRKAGGSGGSKEQFEQVLRRNYPEYFSMVEKGDLKHPVKPRAGMRVVFNTDQSFGNGRTIVPKGTGAVIIEATASKITLEVDDFRGTSGYLCRMSVRELGNGILNME